MRKKRVYKKEDNKRKKEKCDNLDDNEKEQLRKYEKKGKNIMRDNLDGKKEHFEKEDNKRKKEKRDNLNNNGKEQLGKYKKKEKKESDAW